MTKRQEDMLQCRISCLAFKEQVFLLEPIIVRAFSWLHPTAVFYI
jgi:hypothetical protein